jgi:hypothetical protein
VIAFAHSPVEVGFCLYLLLSFESFSYILDNFLLSDIWFADIFFPFCSLYFYSLNRVFHKQKFLILMKSNLSIFPFMDCIISVKSKNSLPNSRP